MVSKLHGANRPWSGVPPAIDGLAIAPCHRGFEGVVSLQRLFRIILGVLAVTVAAGLTAALAGYSQRDALGAVVAGCALNKTLSGSTFPCLAIEQGQAASAYALIRPPGNPTEILLVPTADVPGIEAPGLLGAGGAHYWQAAVAAALGRPLERSAVALAVNSKMARTQDRFHIHVDCLGDSERAAFAEYGRTITAQWSRFPVQLEKRTFWARTLAGSDLSAANPVALMLQGLPFAARDPGAMSLAIVGATLADGSDGFYLVAEQALPRRMGTGEAEDLLDHYCGRP